MVYKVYTDQTNIGLATNIVLIDDRTCVNFLILMSCIILTIPFLKYLRLQSQNTSNGSLRS